MSKASSKTYYIPSGIVGYEDIIKEIEKVLYTTKSIGSDITRRAVAAHIWHSIAGQYYNHTFTENDIINALEFIYQESKTGLEIRGHFIE